MQALLCPRQHPARPCAGCGQNRRHLAAGLCARCYRLSRTRLAICPRCGEPRPVYFGDRCERCKRRAAARAGACQDCGKEVARLWSGRCRSCDEGSCEATGVCADCGELTNLASGLCKACRHFRWRHPAGTCPVLRAASSRSARPVPAGPARPRHRAAGPASAGSSGTRRSTRPVLSPAGRQLLGASPVTARPADGPREYAAARPALADRGAG